MLHERVPRYLVTRKRITGSYAPDNCMYESARAVAVTYDFLAHLSSTGQKLDSRMKQPIGLCMPRTTTLVTYKNNDHEAADVFTKVFRSNRPNSASVRPGHLIPVGARCRVCISTKPIYHYYQY